MQPRDIPTKMWYGSKEITLYPGLPGHAIKTSIPGVMVIRVNGVYKILDLRNGAVLREHTEQAFANVK